MLPKPVVVLWLLWLALCTYGLTSVQTRGRSLKQHTSEALHALFLRPPPRDRPSAATPLQHHLRQQAMLDSLHRQGHDQAPRLRRGQRSEAPAAGAPPATAARPGPAGGAGAGAAAEPGGGGGRLAELQQRWPQGYVAVCAVVKDQNADLRYWVEYHRWLGVSKFYILDNNSSSPAVAALWDLVQEGVVDYQYFVGRPRSKPDFKDTNQYRAYQGCLLQHFRAHRWLAFIDIDEFLVVRPPAGGGPPVAPGGGGSGGGGSGSGGSGGGPPGAPGAPGGGRQQEGWDGGEQRLEQLLSGLEHAAAVGVNWVLFGSSGLQERPPEGPLAAYSSCVPQEHWESTHVKVIANTGGVLGMGPTPHEVAPRPRWAVVDVDGTPFTGPKTPAAKWHKLVIHHYVLKSRAEFALKNARGSGAGNVKDWAFFNYMDGLSNATCAWGRPLSDAFLAAGPRLRLPEGGGLPCGGGGDGGSGAADGARHVLL